MLLKQEEIFVFFSVVAVCFERTFALHSFAVKEFNKIRKFAVLFMKSDANV